MRARAVLLCALCLSSAWSASAAVTGVAFVHGTGAQTDATNNYWTAGYVNAVRSGLPNPANYVVINCDFTKYAWDNAAAGCLAGQLTTFINSKGITDLVIETHSYGANVVRWIFSNPTWDSRYPLIIARTRWVNTIAGSSLGTPVSYTHLTLPTILRV